MAGCFKCLGSSFECDPANHTEESDMVATLADCDCIAGQSRRIRPHDLWCATGRGRTRTITPERLLEENEALRQIIREALPLVATRVVHVDDQGLLDRMRAAIGETNRQRSTGTAPSTE